MLKDLFQNMSRNFLSVFRGSNLLWHALAIVLTAILVLSGADWWYFEHTRGDIFYWIILCAGIGGFFVPIVVPLGLYLWGKFRGARQLTCLAAAAGQASLIGYFVSTLYKVFTGRTQPEYMTHLSALDISKDFHFGILENGIFWGWPSSHAAVAFAGATALALLSRRKSVRVVAYAYAVFVGLGASIGFHWLSDVVAGVIMGILVGIIVAKSYAALVYTSSTSS